MCGMRGSVSCGFSSMILLAEVIYKCLVNNKSNHLPFVFEREDILVHISAELEEYAFSCHGSYSFSLKFSTWSITSLNTSGVYWGGYPFLTRQILISCLS